MATTPPLRTAISTPATPLHGARYDSFELYSTRRSTRRSTHLSKRAPQTTPPPNLQPQITSTFDLKDGSSRFQIAHSYSPLSSTDTSPQKKPVRSRKVADSTHMDGSNPSINLSTCEPSQDSKVPSSLHLPTTNAGPKMLPTPAKTPRKKQVHSVALASAARVLFPVRPENAEEALPTPRKHGRKRKLAGFSFDSSMEDGDILSEEGGVAIYTDSKDRVPELDLNEENPFYDNPAQSRPSQGLHKTKGRMRKIAESVGEENAIEEALKHEEGMFYVFRGKKIFRKFPSETDSSPGSPLFKETELELGSSNPRPFTRSAVKPRLLWPSTAHAQERSAAPAEDEEATTEVEDQPQNDSDMTDLAHETDEEVIMTPVKSSFRAPTTPPASGRATRAATQKAKLNSTPAEPEDGFSSSGRKIAKNLSPFDSWQRTKATVLEVKKGKKREGELLNMDGGGKKMRGKGARDRA